MTLYEQGREGVTRLDHFESFLARFEAWWRRWGEPGVLLVAGVGLIVLGVMLNRLGPIVEHATQVEAMRVEQVTPSLHDVEGVLRQAEQAL